MGHGEAKVTIMVIKADLECDKCYKKIKRTLCHFDQIQDQVYDEKNNTVTIKVVCCSPDDIMKKITRKGGASVKSIEIKKPPAEKPKPPAEKPKEAEKKTEDKPKQSDKPKEAEKPTKPKEAEKPPPQVAQPKQPDPVPQPQPMISYPMMAYPVALPSYGGGPPPQYPLPYHHGSYEVMYARPVYDSWGGGGSRGYYDNRCDYFSEENPSACSIM